MRTMMIVAGLALLATPAIAQQGGKKTSKDPNRVICKTTDVIGSRLQTKRTCMTAAEWQILEREQRSTTERIQSYKPNQG
ncbi:MAG: hypothetical protein V4574_19275 [Pseudomonadota bacterium]